jgi:hypothetical protein
MKKPIIITAVVLGLALIAVILFLVLRKSTNEPIVGPVPDDLFLTIIIHSEEDVGSCKNQKPQIPDYDGDETLTLHFTDVLREFGEMVESHGAKINYGTDWTFAQAVAKYDPDFFTDFEAMGHEIDAHAHESCDDHLYHDVQQDIIDAGGSPTTVASGMTEGEIQHQLTYFDRYYPEFSILWGVALAGHDEGEETSSWVWRPNRDNWLEHNPNGRYIHIGHGDYANSVDYVEDALANRYDNRINTYAVFTKPREWLAEIGTPGIPEQWTVTKKDPSYWENRLGWWDNFLTELDGLDGVHYSTLTEIADIFVAYEDQLDFNFDTDNHPRSNIPGPTKNSQAGYP